MILVEMLVLVLDSWGVRVLFGKYVVDVDLFRWSLFMLLFSCLFLERLFWVEGKFFLLGREFRFVGWVLLVLVVIGVMFEVLDFCVEVVEFLLKVLWRVFEWLW